MLGLDVGTSAILAANKPGEQRKSLEVIATLVWLGGLSFVGQKYSLINSNHIFCASKRTSVVT